jgi:hypothetical protein
MPAAFQPHFGFNYQVQVKTTAVMTQCRVQDRSAR